MLCQCFFIVVFSGHNIEIHLFQISKLILFVVQLFKCAGGFKFKRLPRIEEF